MHNDKQDLRIKKTQHLLATTLLSLLEKQSFKKITVNDICTEALVSRSAFYSHFDDKYALLSFSMELLQQGVRDKCCDLDVRTVLRYMLENVTENVTVFRNLITADLDREVMDMFRRMIFDNFQQALQEQKLDTAALPGPPEVVFSFYTAGIASVMMLWIGKNMTYGIDEILDSLCSLLPKPMLEFK